MRVGKRYRAAMAAVTAEFSAIPRTTARSGLVRSGIGKTDQSNAGLGDTYRGVGEPLNFLIDLESVFLDLLIGQTEFFDKCIARSNHLQRQIGSSWIRCTRTAAIAGCVR